MQRTVAISHRKSQVFCISEVDAKPKRLAAEQQLVSEVVWYILNWKTMLVTVGETKLST